MPAKRPIKPLLNPVSMTWSNWIKIRVLDWMKVTPPPTSRVFGNRTQHNDLNLNISNQSPVIKPVRPTWNKSNENYTISSVMHTFWLVLTYDLLEGRRMDDIIIKTFLPYSLIFHYIIQMDSKLPYFCSVIDHRGRQNVVRTSVTHSVAPRVPLFCSYHVLTSSVIYYWTDARQLGIYLLII